MGILGVGMEKCIFLFVICEGVDVGGVGELSLMIMFKMFKENMGTYHLIDTVRCVLNQIFSRFIPYNK